MLKSRLCDYSNTYILVKGAISDAAQAEDNQKNGDKEIVYLKNLFKKY